MPKSGDRSIEILVKRMMQRAKDFADPLGNPEQLRALTTIGLIVENTAKANIRAHGMVDSGRLMNSLKHEVMSQGRGEATVKVGTEGVVYARMNEYGGPFLPHQRRAMFASLSAAGRLDKVKAGKGVIVGDRWLPRPYLRPALNDNRKKILAIIDKAFGVKSGRKD